MISSDDHENMALSQVQQGETQEAVVSALLALASAVDRLADAHQVMSETLTEYMPSPVRRTRPS